MKGGRERGREGGAGEGRPAQIENDEDDEWQKTDAAANGRLAEHRSHRLQPRRYFLGFFLFSKSKSFWFRSRVERLFVSGLQAHLAFSPVFA